MSITAMYKRALGAGFGGQAKVYDYSDETDFAALWGTSRAPSGVPSLLANWGTGTPALVILWDGGLPTAVPSADDRLMFKHLTPLDWALAFSSRVFDTDQLKKQATFAILIIDLTSQRDADLWSIQMRYQLLADMPWVRWCAPLPFLVGGGAQVGIHVCLPILGIPTDPAAYQSLMSQEWEVAPLLSRAEEGKWRIAATAIASTLANAPVQGTGVRLRHLGRHWAASLAQVDEHHDLNNLVGPHVIADIVSMPRLGNGDAKHENVDRVLVNAFLTRLEWSGLTGTIDQVHKKEFQYVPIKVEREIDLLVVDDRLADGWSDVVAFLVGAQPTGDKPDKYIKRIASSSDVQVFGATDPTALLKSLGIVIGDQSVEIDLERYRRRAYDSPIEESTDRAWALVLDLRLFAGEPDRARAWYLALARAARALCAVEPDELAWPGFLSDSSRLERWLDQTALNPVDPRAPTEQDLALSLLPRLCALRWPCTPVLLFSSTARRDVVERLAPYGNIFLGGTKPAILDVAPRLKLEMFLHGWRSEFSTAQGLLAVQRRLVRLRSASAQVATQDRDESRYFHVTLALDETGDFDQDEVSAIGGTCLISTGASASEAVQFAVDFTEDLRESGLNFYSRAPYYTDERQGWDDNNAYIAKKALISNYLQQVFDGYQNNITFGLVRYRLIKENYTYGGSVHHAAYLDGMSRLLSLVLVELLPSIGVTPGHKCTLSIWLPVKQTPHMDQAPLRRARLNALREARLNGLKSEDARRFANDAEVREKERLMPVSEPKAILFSSTYDLRFTRADDALVETVGGYGNAFSILNRAVGSRVEFPDIFKSIRSLKARKLPYSSEFKKGAAKDWVCRDCETFYKLESRCPRCGSSERWADYSVLAHCADALLHIDKFPKEGAAVKVLSSRHSFDVLRDKRLMDFMRVSELLNEGGQVDGFKLAHRHDFFVDGIRVNGTPHQDAPLHRRLVELLAHYAESVNGFTLAELSGLRPRGSVVGSQLGASTYQREGRNAPPKGSDKAVRRDKPGQGHQRRPVDPRTAGNKGASLPKGNFSPPKADGPHRAAAAGEVPAHGVTVFNATGLADRTPPDNLDGMPAITGRIEGSHVFKKTRRHAYLIATRFDMGEPARCYAVCPPITDITPGTLVALKYAPRPNGQRVKLAPDDSNVYEAKITHFSVESGKWMRLDDSDIG